MVKCMIDFVKPRITGVMSLLLGIYYVVLCLWALIDTNNERMNE